MLGFGLQTLVPRFQPESQRWLTTRPPFQGRDAAAFAAGVRRRFWPALRTNWQVWTPVQFVNVNYVPLQVRSARGPPSSTRDRFPPPCHPNLQPFQGFGFSGGEDEYKGLPSADVFCGEAFAEA